MFQSKTDQSVIAWAELRLARHRDLISKTNTPTNVASHLVDRGFDL